MNNGLFTYFLHSPAKFVSRPLTFVNGLSGLSGGFSSLYAVRAEDAEALKQAGSTEGFKGVVYNERLWLDFDSEEASERAGCRLEEMGYDYIAYHTGGRGVHFGILRGTAPSHLLPLQDRAWAKGNFPECDTSIYSHLHLFRVPGGEHEATGKPKQLIVEARTGRSLELPPYEKPILSGVDMGYGTFDVSIFDIPRVMLNSVPAENGHRQHQLVRLVYALKDEALVDLGSALFWVNEVNKMFREPKPQEEVDRLVRGIYG